MIIDAVETKCDAVTPLTHIQVANATWCCEKMGTMWIYGFVSFGNTNFYTINTSKDVRLLSPSYILGDVGNIIYFCPYCGAKIVVNVEKPA